MPQTQLSKVRPMLVTSYALLALAPSWQLRLPSLLPTAFARTSTCWSHGTSSCVRLCTSIDWHRRHCLEPNNRESGTESAFVQSGPFQRPSTSATVAPTDGTGVATDSHNDDDDDAVPQPIVGYHLDDEDHWVAKLRCGHSQHVRHDPPMIEREWVTTPQGREQMLGVHLRCKHCAKERREEEQRR